MAIIELSAQLRDGKGRGAAHKLRSQGLLPGIVYGQKEENRMIAVPQRSFEAVMRRAVSGSVIIDLKLEDQDEDLKVLIKEVQRDPVTSRLLHVDLMHISMDKPVRLEIPVRLTGVAEGVKNEGGFLDHVLRELEIECLPMQIPEVIEIDVSPLHIGDSVHAGDILRDGVEVVTPAERAIVTVHGKSAAELRTEEAEAAAAAEGEVPTEGEAPAEGAEGGEEQGEQESANA
ncbi:MAG: 50S ribosomal protein L25 [Candidatus Eisenbacteria bacterium]|nr:50S ribosomal protein L25 [Candidatus Eisenbacteria bacterium]